MNLRALALAALTAAPSALTLGGCASDLDVLVVARCHSDKECGAGKVCEDGQCVPKDTVSCQAVKGGVAILQPGPPVMDFGEVDTASATQSLALRNIGTCTLTVFEASLASGATSSPFTCPACADDATFPLELFPFRETAMSVSFTPGAIGEFSDELVLLSDDAEYPEIHVPLHARFAGRPEVNALPAAVDFGFLAEGRTVSRNVRLTNRGTGTAKLAISHVEIQPTSTTAFELAVTGTTSVQIDPLSVDHNAGLTVAVRYHPHDVGRHHADLVVTTNDLRHPTFRVPLRGTSETPAKVDVSPQEIRLGPVPIGRTNALPLTIVNQGGTPLEIRYHWGGVNLSTDFSASPQLVPAIQPGQYSELQVLVTATAPGPLAGLLILETNDPTHPTISVPVSAEGQDVAGAQVVKIDMTYETADNSFFANDFRKVDLVLENPYGLVCDRNNPNPTTWAGFGTPTFVSLGSTGQPERIVLAGAQQDGTYRVMLSYAEDCASLPTQIASAILGIGIDLLIAGTLGATIPGVSGQQISQVIDEICLDHTDTSATVTVSINGHIVSEVPAHLSAKGDYVYPVDLVRQNGQFTVR